MPWYVVGAQVKGESPPRRPSDTAWESYPGDVRPTRTERPFPALCGCCAGRSVSFRDTVPPTPIPPPRCPPRKRTIDPRKGYDHPFCACRGRRRDVRPAGRISLVTSSPVRPFPPLCHRPRHCSIVPGTVGTQDDETSPHPPLCGLRSSISRALESAYER
jgi:hypothetical protein